MNSEESEFVRKALEDAEKAQKIHRVKRIVTMVVLIGAVAWLVLQPNDPMPKASGSYFVMIFVSLVLAACTEKIMSLINKNTISVLRAIADLQRR